MTKSPFTARQINRTLRVVPAVALSAALLLAATGCSQGGTAGGAPSAAASQGADVPTLAVVPAAADLLPESIKSAKVLRVAIPTNEPPTQFYKEGTEIMTGINPDIARLIGQALGVDVDIQVATFDAIIPGIAAGRYDMTVSSMTPTEERMKVLDFVDYLQIGTALAVPQGNPLNLDQNSLCGQKVGLLTGSYQLTVNIPDYNAACEAAGKPTIQTSEYQDTRQAISALTSGRQDAVLADDPILNYAATQTPDIEIAAKYDFTNVGVGVPKQDGLVKALSKALDAVITSDAYHEVLATYGVDSGAITDARVNFAQ